MKARVLLVNPSPVRGGAEEMLTALVTRAKRISYLVACLADGPYVEELEKAGARVVRIHAGRLRHPLAWARAVLRLRRLASTADAVVSWQVKGHYYGTPAAMLSQKPSAWWDHGIRPARGEQRFLVDNRLPASLPARLVLCSSEAIAARHRRSRVVYPGVSFERFAGDREEARARLGLRPGERAVGTVGRLQPWKGQHVFLRAAGRVADTHADARFVLIGGTPGGFSARYPHELQRLTADLGIAERVSFLGQREAVERLLPGLDVFVLPSFGEPFGIVVLEAMAAAVPVVATAAGGAPEIVDHDRTGLLVPPGDEIALAAAVERLLGEPPVASRLAASASDLIRTRFGLERFVEEAEEAFVELARGRS